MAPHSPVLPSNPAWPVEPVAPTEPELPAGPVSPTAPLAPVSPTAPLAPVSPTAPLAPLAPTAPIEPAEPVTPVAPILHVASVEFLAVTALLRKCVVPVASQIAKLADAVANAKEIPLTINGILSDKRSFNFILSTNQGYLIF